MSSDLEKHKPRNRRRDVQQVNRKQQEITGYNLRNAPWICGMLPAKESDVIAFERLYPEVSRRLFSLVRHGWPVDPNEIVAPELGMLSTAEMALLYIVRQTEAKRTEPRGPNRAAYTQSAAYKQKRADQERLRKKRIRSQIKQEEALRLDAVMTELTVPNIKQEVTKTKHEPEPPPIKQESP